MNKNQPLKILIILPLPTECLHKIKQFFEASGFNADVYKPEVCSDLIFNCIELYDALIIGETYDLGEDMLEQATKLKAIGVLGAAINVDIEAATEKDIIVEEYAQAVDDVKSAEAMACHFAWTYNTHRTTMKYIPQVKRVEYVKEQNARIKKLEPVKSDLKKSKKWTTQKKVAVGAGAAVATVAGIAAIPFLAGFSAGGVVAGSIAAATQSAIGNVAAGSLFAAMQSVAATTVIGTAVPAATAAAGAGVAGGAAVLMDNENKKKK